MKQEVLEIRSSDNTLIPNTFIKQETSNHLAIIFPGRGYNADMPLLYYTTSVLAERNADILQTRYNYQTEAFESLSEKAQYEKIIGDCSAAFTTAIRQRDYSFVTLVGKSLGTLALGHLLTQTEIAKTKFIWLTPLFHNEHLRQQMMSVKHQALFVIGTKDPLYSKEVLEVVESATGGESLVIENADHGLEVEGVQGSIAIMQQYVNSFATFLDEP